MSELLVTIVTSRSLCTSSDIGLCYQFLVYLPCNAYVRDGIKTDAQGRKIGVAGRMPSVHSTAKSTNEEALVDVEPDDSSVNTDGDDDSETTDEPSIVIQSDVGISQLSPSKRTLNVPRG